MAIKTVNDGYIPGDYWMECDRCGLSHRRSDLKSDGFVNGLMVCRSCWDFKPVYPNPPQDRMAVPIPRPENTSNTANAITWNYTSIGDNVFPDPWITSANDGLWTGGELSQDHVKYSAYSRKITSTATITVTGLTVGNNYRFSASGWLTGGALSILNNGENLSIFMQPILNSWVDDTAYFIATSATVTIEISATATAYVDGLYIQEYLSEDRFLTNGEIIENKNPPSDYYADNTITPSPNYIEWGAINLFPDPDVSTDPTNFTAFDISGVPVVISRPTSEKHSGTHSLLMERAGFGPGSGGAYIEIPEIKISTTYRFKLWVYDASFSWTKYAGFGVSGNTLPAIIITGQSTLTWSESNYFEFTTPSEIVNSNIYFGVKGATILAGYTEYYDTFELNEYINKTTPY